jgi:hypothetical protein
MKGRRMKKSWRQFFRRVAMVCMVTIAGSAAWRSAVCYAAAAADLATDPVYADGWQAGDNGGFGFGPWNFDTDTFVTDPGIQGIDNANPFNNIGTAWTLALPSTNGLPRAGRSFTPLRPGDRLSIVVDNPTQRQFFRGYFIRFSDGPGNICYGGSACTPLTSPQEKVLVSTFEYFTNGRWSVTGDTSMASTLFDTDTAAKGMRIDLTLLTPTTYMVVMDPLGPAASYTQAGTIKGGSGQIDWLEFTFFNTPTDTGSPSTRATDFYISSMQITPIQDPSTAVPGDYNQNGTVDAADYSVWRDHLGQTFALPNRSVANTGPITAADYTFWTSQFGQHAGSGSGGTAAVPEPATSVLLVFAAAGWSLGRRRTAEKIPATHLRVIQVNNRPFLSSSGYCFRVPEALITRRASCSIEPP